MQQTRHKRVKMLRRYTAGEGSPCAHGDSSQDRARRIFASNPDGKPKWRVQLSQCQGSEKPYIVSIATFRNHSSLGGPASGPNAVAELPLRRLFCRPLFRLRKGDAHFASPRIDAEFSAGEIFVTMYMYFCSTMRPLDICTSTTIPANTSASIRFDRCSPEPSGRRLVHSGASGLAAVGLRSGGRPVGQIRERCFQPST